VLPSLASLASDAAVPPLEPVAAYATRPELVDPTLSPDGQVLATSFRSDGEQVLIAHSLFAKEQPRLLRLGKTTLNWIHWPSDDYLVASLRKMEGIQGELYPFDRLFLMRRDLSEARQISPRSHSGISGDDVIYWAPDRSYLLLSMAKSVYDWPEVLRIDLPSGRSSRVVREREGISWWIASQTGEVDAGIGGRRSGNWRVIYRPAPGKPFTRLTSAREDRQTADTPAAGSDGDGDGEDLWIVNLDSETRNGHVLAYQGRDQLGLYEYDFAARAFGKAIFADDLFDIDNFSFRRGQLRWVSYVDDRWRIRWFDESVAGFYADLEKAVAGKIAFVTSESRDGAVRLVQTRSPTDPGTFYVFTEASGKMVPLGQVNRALDGKVLAPTTHVSYPARDGLTIPGYLTLPVGRPAAGLPLVVMPHGGPFVRDTWD
jgi:dipeptidyl aminopeptidase/acylaminoacyl peptidase